jgi:hypothetical protein
VKGLLEIYLNDHLTGATVGVELARRLRSSNADDDTFGPPLAQMCTEIEDDRGSLEEAMRQLDIPRGKVKPAGAWVGEKLGRLKLNGRLTGYSPLSRQLELEVLYMGIAGKARLWRALESSQGQHLDGIDFAQLGERAAGQLARLEQLHLSAVALALPEQVG